MIRFALRAAAQRSIRQLFINACHRADLLVTAAPSLEVIAGRPVHIAIEEPGRGTAGALHALGDRWRGDRLLVINGDVFVPKSAIRALLHAHEAARNDATMLVSFDAHPAYPRAVHVQDGRVIGLRTVDDSRIEGLARMRRGVFTGVQVLERWLVERLPAAGDIIREGYQRWLREGVRVGCRAHAGPWHDLGTPRRYAMTQLHPPPGYDASPAIHRSASVPEACRVGAVVACERASADPRARLRDVLLLPGARAQGELEGCIVPASGPAIRFR